MKYLFLLITLLIFSACADKTAKAQSKFISSGQSKYDVNSSIDKIAASLKSKNYSVVSVFDHESQALKLKQMLYPTQTLNIYNPKIATKMISCNPSISLEFPLRISLYSKIDGSTYFAYTDPEYWSLKHNVKDKECLNLLILIKRDLQDATELITKDK